MFSGDKVFVQIEVGDGDRVAGQFGLEEFGVFYCEDFLEAGISAESMPICKVPPWMKTRESSVPTEQGCTEGVFAARAACGWAQQTEEKQSSTVRDAAAIFMCYECSKRKDEQRVRRLGPRKV